MDNTERTDITEKKPDKKEGKGKVAVEYIITLAAAVAAGLFLNFFILVNARIPSGSMENTIMTGDRVFGLRLAYLKDDPERYDIVIFKYPDDDSTLYIKRIIGLPGETVVISGGQVYVYDPSVDTSDCADVILLSDPYFLGDALHLDDSFCPETPEGGGKRDGVFRVPENSYFMLGDNRNHSKDSRFWVNKYVAREKIVGKAIVRYWPLNKMKTLGYEGDGQ